jgi:hypothetical protein
MSKDVESTTAKELERKASVDSPDPKINILSAVYGSQNVSHDVTDAIQIMVDEGWSWFSYDLMPDFGITLNVTGQPHQNQKLVKKVSSGRRYNVTDQQPDFSLEIRILEYSGFVRNVTCPLPQHGNGCRVSWWNEKEELELWESILKNGTHPTTAGVIY